jgi:hypothetical protein
LALPAGGVFLAEVVVDAADGEVHLGQPPRGVVRLLAGVLTLYEMRPDWRIEWQIDASVGSPTCVIRLTNRC